MRYIKLLDLIIMIDIGVIFFVRLIVFVNNIWKKKVNEVLFDNKL